MIASGQFVAAFDTGTGTLTVRRGDGTPFLTGGAACANTSLGKQSTASGGREHVLRVSAHSDPLGAGQRLTVDCRDPLKLLDLQIDVVVYADRPLVTIEARCTNVSSSDAIVTSLEPVRVVASEGGALAVPGVTACLTNGQMFFDAGSLHTFATDAPRPVKGLRLANDTVGPGTVTSWWNAGLFSGYGREGVALGFLDSTSGSGAVLCARTAEGQISFLGETVFAPSVTLGPGGSIGTGRFAVNLASDAYAALEQYADAVGVSQGARTNSVINGWCSWFYTLGQVSEEEVLRNAAFAAAHLRAFGLAYVQVDDGYQRSLGDWNGNERFPSGMQALADGIKAHGFKPGLWVAPYVISERSEVFRQHPEWLVRRRDGSLQRIGNWDDEGTPEALREVVKHYCLDITIPDAAAWLRELFETIARRWGFEMIKIDFVAWSIFAAERFNDPTLSSAAVYRRGLAIMRAAAGESCHILECGPGHVTVGLIDSMRIEADTNYGYAEAAWNQYFQGPASSMAAAAKRYYFHRRTWVNDVDHVCLDLLSLRQSEAAATLIALSGGNTISGDRLVDLDPTKLEILRKILPSCGEAAVPVDLFDTDVPTTFVLPVERSFGRWAVVALFNPDVTAVVQRRVPLRRLGLDPERAYFGFDFWRQRFVGEIRREISVELDPGSVTLLALHAATGAPQLLSTSRHVAQGALELEDARWDEVGRRFSGVSTAPPRTAHDVFVYVPGERRWEWGAPVRLRDCGAYSLRLVDANVVRVRVRFDEVNRVPWSIDVDDFLG